MQNNICKKQEALRCAFPISNNSVRAYHYDGTPIVEPKLSKYDRTPLQLANERGVKYWTNPTGTTDDSCIYPSRGPQWVTVTKEFSDGQGGMMDVVLNHSPFYSAESICRLPKYGNWPSEVRTLSHNSFKVVQISTLVKVPVSAFGPWYYSLEKQQVAVFTGVLSGEIRNYRLDNEVSDNFLNDCISLLTFTNQN